MLPSAETIARYMAQHSPKQIAQTDFRLRLVEAWQIPPGAKVLEIGCGQGDMTAVLAHVVGAAGHVTAVDLASPDYGAPLTLQQSTDHLKSTPLGQQVTFHFRYDILDPSRSFSSGIFDYAVLAHSSWYFADIEQLRETFARLRPWAKQLCFSEWDMEPQSFDQVAHFLAVLLQGQLEIQKTESVRNIRTPLSRRRLKQLLEETGWSVEIEIALDTSLLYDARWEIYESLTSVEQEAEVLLPAKTREFLCSQIDTLRALAEKGNRPLSSYAFRAK